MTVLGNHQALSLSHVLKGQRAKHLPQEPLDAASWLARPFRLPESLRTQRTIKGKIVWPEILLTYLKQERLEKDTVQMSCGLVF